jgi:hypothetical protein
VRLAHEVQASNLVGDVLKRAVPYFYEAGASANSWTCDYSRKVTIEPNTKLQRVLGFLRECNKLLRIV